MKHTKKVSVPETEKVVEYKVTCDLCDAEIKPGFYDAEEVEIKHDVRVRHQSGTSYPEGLSGQEVSVDMCGKCFDDKLVPWLRSLGVEPVVEKF